MGANLVHTTDAACESNSLPPSPTAGGFCVPENRPGPYFADRSSRSDEPQVCQVDNSDAVWYFAVPQQSCAGRVHGRRHTSCQRRRNLAPHMHSTYDCQPISRSRYTVAESENILRPLFQKIRSNPIHGLRLSHKRGPKNTVLALQLQRCHMHQ